MWNTFRLSPLNLDQLLFNMQFTWLMTFAQQIHAAIYLLVYNNIISVTYRQAIYLTNFPVKYQYKTPILNKKLSSFLHKEPWLV